MHYSAFISYRRSDGTKTANWLRDALQSYRLPKTLRDEHPEKLRIFLDTAYERGAHHFYEKTIQPALMAAEYLIVLATPDAVSRAGPVQDDWMAREIRDFSQGPNAENVIVVRAAGDFDGPLPGNLSEIYPNAQIIDLRGVTDLNFFNFGRSAFFDNEKIKIVAALHDVPLIRMPILRREAERRRQARLGLFTGIGVAAISLSVGLSIYSIRAQILGQSSIDESLVSAEAIVKDVSQRLWTEKKFKRPGDPAIRAACQVANRLAVRATQERSQSVMALCDMEYAIQTAPQRNPDPDVPYFAGAELTRLAKLGETLFREHAKLDLDEVQRRAQLALSTLKFRHRFHFTKVLEKHDTEIALASEIAEVLTKRATGATDDDDRQAAARAAFDWQVLVVDETLKRASALEKSKSRAFLIEALDAPFGTQAVVEKLIALTKFAPENTSDYFSTLHLIADMQGTFLVDEGKHEEASEKYRASLEYLKKSSADALKSPTPWEMIQRWDILAKLNKIDFRERGFQDRYRPLNAIFLEILQQEKRLGNEQHPNQENFWEIRNRVVEDLHLILDDMRRDARKRAGAKELSAAHTGLSKEVEWREKLYRNTGDTRDWAKLFVMIGEQVLAGIDTDLGNHRQAEDRRIRFHKKFRSMDLNNRSLDGQQYLDFDASRRAVSRAHYNHLDRLRTEAAKAIENGDHGQAIAKLVDLQTDDRTWDLANGAFSETGRVYTAEIGFMLADSLDAVGQRPQGDRVRTRVVRELLPLVNKNNLSEDWLGRAKKIWSRATEWMAERGIDQNTLEPIVDIAPFEDIER